MSQPLFIRLVLQLINGLKLPNFILYCVENTRRSYGSRRRSGQVMPAFFALSKIKFGQLRSISSYRTSLFIYT